MEYNIICPVNRNTVKLCPASDTCLIGQLTSNGFNVTDQREACELQR